MEVQASSISAPNQMIQYDDVILFFLLTCLLMMSSFLKEYGPSELERPYLGRSLRAAAVVSSLCNPDIRVAYLASTGITGGGFHLGRERQFSNLSPKVVNLNLCMRVLQFLSF